MNLQNQIMFRQLSYLLQNCVDTKEFAATFLFNI